jgi:hypothetical protein
LGSARHDLQVDEDGNAVGRGVEPSAHAIHLGSSWGDFSVGDRVYGWWWGLLWPAVIHHKNMVERTLTLRWTAFKKKTPGYPPQLVTHRPSD